MSCNSLSFSDTSNNNNKRCGCVLGGGIKQSVGGFATLLVHNKAPYTEVQRVGSHSTQ